MTISTELPVLNVEDLRVLIEWAVRDDAINNAPGMAVTLGLTKDTDPRLGRWSQAEWASAKKNGICQTAHCIAGGAAVLATDWVEIMYFEHHDDTLNLDIYSGGYMIRKDSPFLQDLGLAEKVKEGVLYLTEEEWSDMYRADLSVPDGDGFVHVGVWARTYLGLTATEGETLFSGGNDIPRIIELSMLYARQRDQSITLAPWVHKYVESYYGEVIHSA